MMAPASFVVARFILFFPNSLTLMSSSPLAQKRGDLKPLRLKQQWSGNIIRQKWQRLVGEPYATRL